MRTVGENAAIQAIAIEADDKSAIEISVKGNPCTTATFETMDNFKIIEINQLGETPEERAQISAFNRQIFLDGYGGTNLFFVTEADKDILQQETRLSDKKPGVPENFSNMALFFSSLHDLQQSVPSETLIQPLVRYQQEFDQKNLLLLTAKKQIDPTKISSFLVEHANYVDMTSEEDQRISYSPGGMQVRIDNPYTESFCLTDKEGNIKAFVDVIIHRFADGSYILYFADFNSHTNERENGLPEFFASQVCRNLLEKFPETTPIFIITEPTVAHSPDDMKLCALGRFKQQGNENQLQAGNKILLPSIFYPHGQLLQRALPEHVRKAERQPEASQLLRELTASFSTAPPPVSIEHESPKVQRSSVAR